LRRSTGEAPGDLTCTGGLGDIDGDAPIDRDVLQDQTHVFDRT
jgi:hypothetical protein